MTPARRRNIRPGRRWASACTAIGAMVLAAWPLAALIERYQVGKLASQPAALALERTAGADGARVAYVGANEPYLFFGTRLQNDVEIVPTSGGLAAQYYSWGGTARFPFTGGSRQQWRHNLAALSIRFVVAARSSTEGPERAWMASDPSSFHLIDRAAGVEIWRFDPT